MQKINIVINQKTWWKVKQMLNWQNIERETSFFVHMFQK